jgi:3-mercaptopyruvate sulfurtransferase SseA
MCASHHRLWWSLTCLSYCVFLYCQVLTAAGVDVAAPALAYCNGGVASTVVMFALHQLGNDNVTNYDGSWNEYGNRDYTIVETGSAP